LHSYRVAGLAVASEIELPGAIPAQHVGTPDVMVRAAPVPANLDDAGKKGVTCCLLLARLGLIFVPFPKLARRLGDFVPPSDPRVLAARARGSQQDAALAQDIGWAVTRSARYLPFKAVCLPQAMAARVMLERRGVSSVLHFGAARGQAA
jgi:hypothetical protein